jgi:hypothetical protein
MARDTRYAMQEAQRMVELITDDGIFLTKQRLKQTTIGIKRSCVQDSVLCSKELR